MERLTKTVNGVVTYIGQGNEFDTGMLAAELSSGQIRTVLDHLSAYEETGLEPEEIRYFGDLREMKREIIFGVTAERLKELAEADKEGRLVALPSKTVWELTMDAGPDCDLKCPVDAWDESLGCDLCSKAKQFAYERPCTQERLKELGKTVFLTREEAEAALAAACKERDEARKKLHEAKSELAAMRNELCYLCGKYREAHNGACDGCRWRKDAQ